VNTLLRTQFVCTRENTEGDPNAGGSIAHRPGEPAGRCIRGNGEHNVQLLALTPEGRIFWVLAGYVAPRELEAELRAALSTFRSLGDPGRATPEERVAGAHRDMIREIEKRPFDGPLGDWERRRALEDHRFMTRHPLLDAASFRPAMLVGNGRTYFSSSRGGRRHEGIGDTGAARAAQEALDALDAAGARAGAEDGAGDDADAGPGDVERPADAAGAR